MQVRRNTSLKATELFHGQLSSYCTFNDWSENWIFERNHDMQNKSSLSPRELKKLLLCHTEYNHRRFEMWLYKKKKKTPDVSSTSAAVIHSKPNTIWMWLIVSLSFWRPSWRSSWPTRTPNTRERWAISRVGSRMRLRSRCGRTAARRTAANLQRDRHRQPRARWDTAEH